MKKIINGKLYNTSTATLMAEYENCGNMNDISYYCENLYIKKTGEFFIYGFGSPNSKYRKYVGENSWYSGDAIVPLTYDEARNWMEKYADVDKYIEVFGEPEE